MSTTDKAVQWMTGMKPFHTWKKKKVPVKDSLDKEIKRLDVASQTPKERRARQNRRWHMLRTKPS